MLEFFTSCYLNYLLIALSPYPCYKNIPLSLHGSLQFAQAQWQGKKCHRRYEVINLTERGLAGPQALLCLVSVLRLHWADRSPLSGTQWELPESSCTRPSSLIFGSRQQQPPKLLSRTSWTLIDKADKIHRENKQCSIQGNKWEPQVETSHFNTFTVSTLRQILIKKKSVFHHIPVFFSMVLLYCQQTNLAL